MLAKKELQELAHVLKTAPEYTEMVRQRRKIMGNPRLSRQMLNFEREHTRLINLNLTVEEVNTRLEKLHEVYKDFFEQQDIKEYIEATQNYQKMIFESIDYLNSLLDISNGSKSY